MNKFANKRMKEVPVFFSSDNNYVPFLVVSIQSLIDTASVKNKYNVYVLNTGLSLENRKILKAMETHNVKIKFVDVSMKVKDIYSKLEAQLRDYYSPSIYYRLFIASMFPRLKKALYLDCDITIVEDIANLYNKELGNNLVGAIADEVVENNELLQDYVERAVGVPNKQYFNSGILVMNLNGFRKEKIEQKFIYLLNNYPFSSVAPDQDYLNILCKDRVLYIDKGWDKMPMPDANFNEKNLKLVHYNMFQKPWKYTDVLFEKYFWDTAKKTRYYDELIAMRESYTEEKKAKDTEAGMKMVQYATEVANDPNNFKNTIDRETADTEKDENYSILEDFLNLSLFNNPVEA